MHLDQTLGPALWLFYHQFGGEETCWSLGMGPEAGVRQQWADGGSGRPGLGVKPYLVLRGSGTMSPGGSKRKRRSQRFWGTSGISRETHPRPTLHHPTRAEDAVSISRVAQRTPQRTASQLYVCPMQSAGQPCPSAPRPAWTSFENR